MLLFIKWSIHESDLLADQHNTLFFWGEYLWSFPLLFIECLTEKYEPKGEREKVDTNEKTAKKKNKSKWYKDFKGFWPFEPFFRDTDMHVCLKHGQLIFISEKSKGEEGVKDTKDELWWYLHSDDLWHWCLTPPKTNCHSIDLHFLFLTTFTYLLKLIVKFLMLVQ